MPVIRTWIDYRCEVGTDPLTLHGLLADIDRWPLWVPGMMAIRRPGKGDVRQGSFFLMTLAVPRLGRMWLPNRVFVLSDSRIEWGGGIPGGRIHHGFELEALDSGGTRLRHYEYATRMMAVLAGWAGGFARAHDRRWSDVIQQRFESGPAS